MSTRYDEEKDFPLFSVNGASLRRRAEEKASATGIRDLRSLSPDGGARLLHELQVHQIELEMQNEELRRAQEELEDSRARYFDLYDLAPVGYITLNEHSSILETNLTAAKLLGLPKSSLTKTPLTQYILPDDQDTFYRHRKRLFETGEPQVFEIRVMDSDGVRLWARVEAHAARDGENGPSVCRAVLIDITERKMIENAQLFLARGVWTASGEDFFEALARYLGESLGMDYVCIDRLEGDMLSARTLAIYFDGKFVDNVTYTLQDTPCAEVMKKEICCFPKDVRHLFPSDLVLQEMKAESYVGTVLWGSTGQPIGLIALIGRQPLAKHHTTESILQLVGPRAAGELERKQAEEALKESEVNLARAQSISHLANWEVDVGTDKVRGSDELYRMFNLEAGLTLGAYLERFHPDDRADVVESINTALYEGKPYNIDYRIIPRSDDIRHIHAEGAVTYDETGLPMKFFGTVQDITERKKVEEDLRRAKEELETRVQERTAELGQRADQLARLTSQLMLTEQRERKRLAGILHDHLQQILVVAKISSENLAAKIGTEQKPSAEKILDLITQSIQISRSLTVELFPPALQRNRLSASLAWLARWMQEKHGLTVDLQVDPSIDPEREDFTILLFQSVRELLFNVVKHAVVKSARVEMSHDEGGRLRVTVIDHGRGYDPDMVWKKTQEEEGFGLFSIRERLVSLGGSLEVKSSPGRGTSSSLVIPLEFISKKEEKRIERIVAKPKFVMGSGGKIRILLVDDHIVIRQGLSSLLKEHADITVVGEAANGDEAVQTARELRPDVILMDVSMPKLNGIEATRIIHSELPQIRIIGLSMYDDSDAARSMLDAGAVAFLPKSGHSEDLLAAICGKSDL